MWSRFQEQCLDLISNYFPSLKQKFLPVH
jgi:hypothetical protein